jgi:hypothetical protein
VANSTASHLPLGGGAQSLADQLLEPVLRPLMEAGDKRALYPTSPASRAEATAEVAREPAYLRTSMCYQVGPMLKMRTQPLLRAMHVTLTDLASVTAVTAAARDGRYAT